MGDARPWCLHCLVKATLAGQVQVCLEAVVRLPAQDWTQAGHAAPADTAPQEPHAPERKMGYSGRIVGAPGGRWVPPEEGGCSRRKVGTLGRRWVPWEEGTWVSRELWCPSRRVGVKGQNCSEL